MPELPEVETVARGMKSLEGRVLTYLQILDAKVWFESEFIPAEFHGECLREVSRRGKYILYRFAPQKILVQHLRMTGKMLDRNSLAIPTVVKNQIGTDGEKARQARAIFSFSNKEVVFFDPRRFGTLSAIRSEANFFGQKNIAPDPLHQPDEAREKFLQSLNSERPLKATLLDQSAVAGVGNIYADEALFALGIHPLMPTRKLRRKEDLWEKIIQLFQRAIQSGGTSVYNYVNSDGESGTFANLLQVYGKTGESCLRCGGKIRAQTIAGRTSHFCGRCQKKSDSYSKKRSG
jgi:formamidopyrimidine-DNA glycosylase